TWAKRTSCENLVTKRSPDSIFFIIDTLMPTRPASSSCVRPSVVGDDLLEHGVEGGNVDRLVPAYRDGTSGLVVMAAGDDAIRIGHDGAVVQKDVDLILPRPPDFRRLEQWSSRRGLRWSPVPPVSAMATGCRYEPGEKAASARIRAGPR